MKLETVVGIEPQALFSMLPDGNARVLFFGVVPPYVTIEVSATSPLSWHPRLIMAQRSPLVLEHLEHGGLSQLSAYIPIDAIGEATETQHGISASFDPLPKGTTALAVVRNDTDQEQQLAVALIGPLLKLV